MSKENSVQATLTQHKDAKTSIPSQKKVHVIITEDIFFYNLNLRRGPKPNDLNT